MTTAVPSNELATLPELSQRRALRDLADYITERAAASAASVVYLPEYQASGLALGPDSALTVSVADTVEGAAEPVRLLQVARPVIDSAPRVLLRRQADTLRFRWALVVARSANGQILSLTGMVGGKLNAQCGDLRLREMVFDTSVPAAFRGGGVFDLDGDAVGLVVPCGERTMLVPLPDVAGAIEQQQNTRYRMWVDLGFRAVPADSLASPPRDSTGAMVTEVRPESAAGRAGLRAGDLIVRADSTRVQSVEDLRTLLSPEGASGLALRRTARGVVLRRR